ncbi:palmitoyltransferase PFA3 [Ascoidea rubescens DSM 1968]|uniref:Palmitoyltransferase n=1 Tax=Ascoidea rubescens DSM 1968 TaxID=1344418 RepID=A0A1D2VCN2_9ASCO|nr:zf-DHHC-domain-containing protein [Ascoidea rubescens DSM 1968]ODV59217.1 zf-DHHC-domain-containing protein [Ascoidea rubescens DSM 1968]
MCVLCYYLVVSVGPGSPLDFPELKIRYNSTASENIYDPLSQAPDLALTDLTDESISHGLENGTIVQPPKYLVLHTFTVKNSGNFRFCNRCKIWKPDRCHHCSTCQKCILKMDHHCPWFASCIGFKNSKYFIQLLSYIVLLTFYCFIVCGYILFDFFFKENYKSKYFNLNQLFLMIISLIFCISVFVFDLFTIYQCSKNQTTIESFESERYRINLNKVNDKNYKYSNQPSSKKFGNIFDLESKSRNIKQVMGNSWIEWVFPIKNKSIHNNTFLDNGLNFPVNIKIYDQLLENARLQNALANQLVNLRSMYHSPDISSENVETQGLLSSGEIV